MAIACENANQDITLQQGKQQEARVGYGLFNEISSQVSREIVLTKYIPGQLFARYMKAAMRRVQVKQLQDDTWYLDLKGFPGVWANGESIKDASESLEEVLLDWLLLKIMDEDRDIPIVDQIDLNVL
jgi:predicted RNase H-like HicB family nuclease